MGGHDAAAANGTWDVASAAIDARAAMQSRCDANAAIVLVLKMQQCHKRSKGHDTYAAKRMHAGIAAIHTGRCCMRSTWIWRNMVTVSVFRCLFVSLFRATPQRPQHQVVSVHSIPIPLLLYEAARQTLTGLNLKMLRFYRRF